MISSRFSVVLTCLFLMLWFFMNCGKDSDKTVTPTNDPSVASELRWEKTNGPYAGKVQCLAKTPSGTLLAGTWDGLYRSIDNGDTWTLTSYDRAIFALAVSTNGYIFAGSGGGTTGLHRSTDDGKNWSSIGSIDAGISTIVVNAQGHVFAGSMKGIFRSTNNGDTWTQINEGLTDDEIHSLAIHADGLIFAGSSVKGVFRSDNNGDTWEETSLGEKSIGALVINKQGHIFAGGNEYIFRSTDKGASWIQLRDGLTDNNINCLAVDKDGDLYASAMSQEGALHHSTSNGDDWQVLGDGWRINAILCSSTDLYIGTEGSSVFHSTDKGQNWIQKSTGFSKPRINQIVINKDDHIFAATDGSGVFRSVDGGNSWRQMNRNLSPMSGFWIKSIGMNEEGTLFIGPWNILRSTDNGESWTVVSDYISSDVVSILCNADGHIFALGEDYGTGIFRSIDNGNSWQQFTNGLGEVFAQTLQINESTGELYLGASDGVYLSKDNGESWTHTALIEPTVICLAVNSSGHIFAGTFDGLFRSTDNGAKWSELKNGFSWSMWIYAVEIRDDGTLIAGGADGLYLSRDNGDSWTESSNLRVVTFAANSKGDVFAGTRENGIYRGVEK